ncbi:MAG: HlyD family secretion protein [Pseudochelatococcus sp.]|jgi:HlyD family secretion protein|uniref:HlyD family secretion protein n=1 Tax=Pseudochelatococcus sp. TaxID=2020869 RepID=UPI003D8F9BED
MGGLAGRWLTAGVALVMAGGVYFGWRELQPDALPEGIASGNGRIEATEIDVATKAAGRIREVLVQEGDFVAAGQILARMDTDQLQAERRQAEAQLKQAAIAVETAKNQVAQRRAEQAAAVAVVAQREAERDAADKKLARSEQLILRDNVSQQVLDDDRARALGARAAQEAAKAQLAAAEAAISAAESQVVGAEAAVDAAHATIERIDADIADSILTSPRDGRVQFLVSRPGEVLAGGGRVLNLVDLSDVYMTFFLPTDQAGRLALGADARIVLDAVPQYVLPAKISFVADVAQFTPKTVETAIEREKLMFRVRAQIPPALLRKYIEHVKTGLPGVAYVRLAADAQWPAPLQETVSP